MSYNLSDSDKALIRHGAGNMKGAQVVSLQNAVAARLQADLDAGVIKSVTKNNVRAALTKELAK
jgi:hypothetical protein